MKIVFQTNIDNYKTNCFPENLTSAPRMGEKVMVVKAFISYFRDKKLPTRLEVVDVTHTEECVICELWYNKTDKEIADRCGAKTIQS
jgi:hypothetical protein